MKYIGSATGRQVNAIGIFHRIQIEFEADNDHDANSKCRDEFYRQGFDHVSFPTCKPSEIPPCLVCGEYGAHMPGCAVTETD